MLVLCWKFQVYGFQQGGRTVTERLARSNIHERNIVFCSLDGCLSLIAEAIGNKLLPPKTQILSVGPKQEKIDWRAFQVLREMGINESHQVTRPESIPTRDIDLVVTLGERAEVQPAILLAPLDERLGKLQIRAVCRQRI
ncbi:MAG TPA: hypothetical protein VIE89_13560 [Candidatus Binatia bacterium]